MGIPIAKIEDYDIADSIDGITVSLWIAGCPHKCKGCHNPELWDYDKYPKIKKELVVSMLEHNLSKDNIKKNLSILGGEPLIPENIEDLNYVISEIRKKFPKISIYIWTGYTLSELKKRNDKNLNSILKNITYLIDGRFEEKNKKILKLRGSTNQNIYKKVWYGFKKIKD